MARVTEMEVQAILDESVSVDDITVFITGANILVTKKMASSGLDDDQLKEIERWLTAHMMSMSVRARATSKEKVGDVSVEYAGQFGKGLEATPYGQMVLALDTTGTMTNLGKKKAVWTNIESTKWE